MFKPDGGPSASTAGGGGHGDRAAAQNQASRNLDAPQNQANLPVTRAPPSCEGFEVMRDRASHYEEHFARRREHRSSEPAHLAQPLFISCCICVLQHVTFSPVQLVGVSSLVFALMACQDDDQTMPWSLFEHHRIHHERGKGEELIVLFFLSTFDSSGPSCLHKHEASIPRCGRCFDAPSRGQIDLSILFQSILERSHSISRLRQPTASSNCKSPLSQPIIS
jgi:hypothetical protein